MDSTKLAGKAQTVLGPIDADSIGVTTVHEHLIFDLTFYFTEPSLPAYKALANQPVRLENRYWVKCHPFEHLDNLIQKNEQVAIAEAMLFKEAGGNTIVDVTSIGLGRDPSMLARIARATGLNIIMGSGYYVWHSRPPDFNSKTEEELADEITRDLTVGVGDPGIRAGIIGEVGNVWPWSEGDRKSLGAAVSAQRRTGAPLSIHPGINRVASLEIIDFLKERGIDFSRVAFDHTERTFQRSDDNLYKVLETGCYIEFDLFGWEGYHTMLFPSMDVPNDEGRINWIAALIAEGYVNQILLAHDICFKVNTASYGGHGFAHILREVVGRMRGKGISGKHIHAMLVDNPRRFLQFAPI